MVFWSRASRPSPRYPFWSRTSRFSLWRRRRPVGHRLQRVLEPPRDHRPGPLAGVVRVHARGARPRRRRVGARIRAVHSIGGVGGVVRRRPLDEVEAGAQPRHLRGDRRLDGLEARPQLGELRLERGRRCRRDLCRAPRRWRVGCHKRTAPGPRRMRRGGRRAAVDVGACVEINQCDGCTRQFFTKSFLGEKTRPCWLRRAVRNRHHHAIEQASRRWRGGRRDDSANAP